MTAVSEQRSWFCTALVQCSCVMLWPSVVSSCTQGFVSSFLSCVICPEMGKIFVAMICFCDCIHYAGSIDSRVYYCCTSHANSTVPPIFFVCQYHLHSLFVLFLRAVSPHDVVEPP